MDVLDNYIVTIFVVPGKDSILILEKIIKHKRDKQNSPIGTEDAKPI